MRNLGVIFGVLGTVLVVGDIMLIQASPGSHGYTPMPTVKWMSFLITVNDTWQKCIKTVATPPLEPQHPYNNTHAIRVGSCDNGPLEFNISYGYKKIHVLFHSSVIEDASPPTCDRAWDMAYDVPHGAEVMHKDNTLPSPLPGCFVSDSREGYHMTNYWFYVLDWKLHEGPI